MQQTRCYLLGERAVVLELSPPVTLHTQKRIWGLTAQLLDCVEVSEAIPGMNNITVILREPQQMTLQAVAWLQEWWEKSEVQEILPRQAEIPVVYGGGAGPDLQEVARHSGLTPQQVVEAHASACYQVYFIGFQPDFPYFAGLNPYLHTPSRGSGYPRVLSVLAAVRPAFIRSLLRGGWQLIGQTDQVLFNADNRPPAYLRPGDSVRFLPQKGGVC